MKPRAASHSNRKRRWRTSLVVAAVISIALLGSTAAPAEAQTEARRAQDVRVEQVRAQDVRPQPTVEKLRLDCNLDFLDGQRGVLCRWSEATNSNTRAYQLYRIVNGSARELVTTVGPDGRLGFFDTDITAPSSLIYGVITVNGNGRLIGRSAPVHVQYGQDVESLRMACAPDSIEGHRGVLCRWSETTQPTARGYVVYRAVGDGPRETIGQVAIDGRQAFFDRNVTPGAVHTYVVAAVDGDGTVVAQGGPRHVRWPAAD